jgi:hypothetical protein
VNSTPADRDRNEELTVTTVLQRSGQTRTARHAGQSKDRFSWFTRDPAWPLVVALVGWPVWWALGIENQIFILAAIPMIWRLYRLRHRTGRSLRLPPGFAIWALFFIVMLAGAVALSLQAPETIQSPVASRLAAWGYRAIDYGAATVTLLYVGNLTEREFPRRRLAWLLGLVGIYAILGGLLGVVDPTLSFTSPIARFLPANVQTGLGVALNPGSSQVTGILGFSVGRVKAPFTYTNQWGDCLAILLPWLYVAWRSYGTRIQRRAAVVLLAIAIVPAVISLDRGLWIGIVVGVVYIGVRLAAHGKLAVLGVLGGALAIGVVVILVSPLGGLVSQRLNNGKSDTIRASLTYIAVRDAASSPLIGYGDTRHMQGSTQSIAVGSTSNCEKCGNSSVGGNGQLPLLLISTGFLGTALYIGFFAYCLWRYRRDKTPYGMAGGLVLILGFVFLPVYDAAGPPLAFTMLAVALLWRNGRELEAGAAAARPRWRKLADPATTNGIAQSGGHWPATRA